MLLNSIFSRHFFHFWPPLSSLSGCHFHFLAAVRRWDSFITLILTKILDEETRTEWKQYVGRRTNVATEELIDFLETRAMDLQPSEGDRLSQMLRGSTNQHHPRRNIFAIGERAGESPKKEEKMSRMPGGPFSMAM